MKIYDITQPLFECTVFPGDEPPKKIPVRRMDDGYMYNLTNIEMCAHNGTHIDAPYHFINDGKTVDALPLEKFIGPCYVCEHTGDVLKLDAVNILEAAKKANPESAKRILIKGKATVTLEGAKVFSRAGLELIGNESQTFGPEDSPADVHIELLGAEIVLLEGIRLEKVPEGVYCLNCAPLILTNTDGSPCRAVLTEMK